MSQRLSRHKASPTSDSSLRRLVEKPVASPRKLQTKAVKPSAGTHPQLSHVVQDEPANKGAMSIEPTAAQPSPYAAKYIQAMVGDLKKLASKSGLTRVALILEMAELEASDHTERGH